MTSRSPPVPSKNALRALRGLALGAPGLLVGAFGGVCGLVAVNCEARRKVRLAEKILDRKRTITSIANGRSSSRVRHMFEAAEKGEDFLLDPSKSHKRRQRRNYSPATAARKHNEEDVEAMLQAIGGRVIRNQKSKTRTGSEDGRTGPGQPTKPKPEKISTAQAPAEEPAQQEPAQPWLNAGGGSEHHRAFERPLHSRRADRLQSAKNIINSGNMDSGTAFWSRGRRSLLSVGGVAQTTQTQLDEIAQDLAHSEALQRQYARDLRESPAERIRLATMKPMKQNEHSVYGRSSKIDDWSIVTGDVQRETLETLQKLQTLHLDLAPRVNDGALQGSEADTQDRQVVPGPDSVSTIVSQGSLPEIADGARPALHGPHHGQLQSIGSSFVEWPGIPQAAIPEIPHSDLKISMESRNLHGSDEKELRVRREIVGDVPDISGDNINIFNFFNHTYENFDRKGSEANIPEHRGRSQHSSPDAATEAKNERAERAKWLYIRHGRPQVGWLALLKRLKGADVWISSLEHDIVHHGIQTGQKAIAHKTWASANKRKNQLLEEDVDLLAVHWAVAADVMKRSTSNQTEMLKKNSSERSLASDMFLVPPPTLGQRAQVDLAEVIRDVDYELYIDACVDIMSYEYHSQSQDALARKLQNLVAEGSEQDLKLAELLFHGLSPHLQRPSHFLTIPPAAMDLAHNLFSRGLHSRAASILFPHEPKDSERVQDKSRAAKANFLYRNANLYLARRCYAIRGSAMLSDEIRQLLGAASSVGIAPREYPIDHLILPAIRGFCARGLEADAARLLKEVQTDHNIQFTDTLGIRQAIIFAHANRNNVVHMKLMLEEIHAKGVSRTNVQWFSQLFDHVFQRLLVHNPLAESYDLLVHAMAYWGLMPDSRVSSSLISACLKEERYDFVQEYVQAIRQLYPFLDLGTNGPLCAWRVARAWKEMEASCEDVQKGCLAMAYCATSDPFGKSLRDVAEEAVRVDISRCLSGLLSITLGHDQSQIFKQLRYLDFDKLIEQARKSITAPESSSKKPYMQARDRLLKQIKAVTKLNKLFGGDHMGDRIETSTRQKSGLRKRLLVSDNGVGGVFAEAVFQDKDILPERLTLWRLIARHYAHRQMQGLSADHDLLRHVVMELNRLERAPEAAHLLNAIWQSPYTFRHNGTPFSEETLHLWFDTGVLLSSAKVMAQALWAFVEASHDVIVSESFMVRVNMAHKKFEPGLVAKNNARSPEAFNEEMQYLVRTLKQRHERQMGINFEEDRKLWNEYKSWDEMTTTMPNVNDEERMTRGGWLPDQSSVGRTLEAVRAY